MLKVFKSPLGEVLKLRKHYVINIPFILFFSVLFVCVVTFVTEGVLKMDKDDKENVTYSFFQSLTSVCPISCHIFKTLNTISTASVFFGPTIDSLHVVFTQYAVSKHISTMLTFS